MQVRNQVTTNVARPASSLTKPTQAFRLTILRLPRAVHWEVHNTKQRCSRGLIAIMLVASEEELIIKVLPMSRGRDHKQLGKTTRSISLTNRWKPNNVPQLKTLVTTTTAQQPIATRVQVSCTITTCTMQSLRRGPVCRMTPVLIWKHFLHRVARKAVINNCLRRLNKWATNRTKHQSQPSKPSQTWQPQP